MTDQESKIYYDEFNKAVNVALEKGDPFGPNSHYVAMIGLPTFITKYDRETNTYSTVAVKQWLLRK